MITEVRITKSALKDLKRTPLRSIRLNKQWRAIYIIKGNGTIEFVKVTEVTPHEY